MPNTEWDLNSALQNLHGGQPSQADIARIVEAISSGELQLRRTISVGGDVTNSVQIIGNNNTVELTSDATALLTRVSYKPPRKPAKGKLPKGLGLPPAARMLYTQNNLFTGREEPLHSLAKTLLYQDKNASALISQAIQGMGGIGKTQLAVEFAYRYGVYFHGVHWINAATPAAIEDEIAACGDLMNLQPWPADSKARAAITLEAWKANGPRLVVFDNIEDQGAARDWFSKLQHQNIRLLVTSRQSNWPTDLGLRPLTLEVFSELESIAFLRKYLPDKNRASHPELETLTARLGHLPLALELAGRFLQAISSLKINDYIAQLSLDHPSLKNWRKDKGSPTRHELDVAQTFALSWERVKEPTAHDLFIIAGYFTPNLPIPKAALAWAKDIEEGSTLDESLSILIELALLKPEITLHPLLSEFARVQDKEKTWLYIWARSLAAVCYPGNSLGGIYSSPLLAQHARAALPDLIKVSKLRHNKEISNLPFHTAFIQTHFGDLDGAMNLYMLSLDIFKGSGDLQGKSATLHQMAGIYATRGDLDEAMKLYTQSLKIKEDLGDLQGKSSTLHQMAGIYVTRGDLDGAMKLYKQSHKAFEGLNDLQGKSSTLHQMAGIYVTRGDLDRAMKLYAQSLKIFEDLGNLQGKSTTLHQMAGIYIIRGDLDEAMKLYVQSLEIAENLGDLRGKSATLHQMAGIFSLNGNLEEAKRLYQESLKIHEKLGNVRGKFTTLAMIGQLFIKTDEYEKGLSILIESAKKLKEIEANSDLKKLIGVIKDIRLKIGFEKFDDIWKNVTGELIPSWLEMPVMSLKQPIRKPNIPKDAAVLVVEDNVSNFVLIARMLGYLGIHCEWKTSGYEVVEYADTLPRLDLILMDIRLPNEDGYGALKKIRASERFKAVPIIAVTAEASVEQMTKAKDSGFDGFLGKPLDPDLFPDQIRRILSGESVWEFKSEHADM